MFVLKFVIIQWCSGWGWAMIMPCHCIPAVQEVPNLLIIAYLKNKSVIQNVNVNKGGGGGGFKEYFLDKLISIDT